MWIYPAIPIGRGPAGLMVTLAMLALATPDVQSGFQAPLNFDAGSQPVSVAVGDFNHDGIADLAVVNNGSNNVSVLRLVRRAEPNKQYEALDYD